MSLMLFECPFMKVGMNQMAWIGRMIGEMMLAVSRLMSICVPILARMQLGQPTYVARCVTAKISRKIMRWGKLAYCFRLSVSLPQLGQGNSGHSDSGRP